MAIKLVEPTDIAGYNNVFGAEVEHPEGVRGVIERIAYEKAWFSARVQFALNLGSCFYDTDFAEGAKVGMKWRMSAVVVIVFSSISASAIPNLKRGN